MSKLECNFLQSKNKQEPLSMVFNSSLVRFRSITLLTGCIVGGILLSHNANASYAVRIENPSTGYLIKLSSNSTVETTPVKGTNGKDYYRVGKPIVLNASGDPSVSVTGTVLCRAKTWGNSANYLIGPDNAFHRLFMYVPMTGTFIEGETAYNINSNLVMTVNSRVIDWTNISAIICANSGSSTLTASANQFAVQFPITITFYINDRIIDGQLPIAPIDLGGYVRAFTDPKRAPSENSWPINESSVPMRLAASQLNVGASCTTMSSTGQAATVSLRHGQLNTLNYDSSVTEKVIYTCKFSTSTKVRLRLDYATDSDPQQRLPMIGSENSNDRIYSELNMTDETTGQTGKDFKIDIENLRTIKINSHIQGTNAAAGEYKGSAWLIATFD